MASSLTSAVRLLGAGLTALSFSLSAAAGGLPGNMDAHAGAPLPTDRLIVKYRDAESMRPAPPLASERLARLQAVAGQHGVRAGLLRAGAVGAHILKLDRPLDVAQAAGLAVRLRAADPQIEYAEPDRILHPLMTPNDGYFSYQWDLQEGAGGIGATKAWDVSTGSGVVVAVVDTGYRPHVDLAANIVAGYDFINDTLIANDGTSRDDDARDPGDWVAASQCGSNAASSSSWHGTHVAGTVAAVGGNGTGVIGVAFGARVQPLRVLGRCGGYTSDIADAIAWASGGTVAGVPANATPARVINLSLGGPGACDNTMQAAINGARVRNAVVVVAAGNSSADASLFSPASCTGVVTVAATDRDGARAYYSNYGSAVALAAPGGDLRGSALNGILSTLNDGSTTPANDIFAFYQGTSMAAPHVAGVAALMISRNPALTPDQVIAKLKATARAFPAACSGCGSGLLDAYAAVQSAAPALARTAESEPNNSLSQANPVAAPSKFDAQVSSLTDQDWYSVDLSSGNTLNIAVATSGDTRLNVHLYDSLGGLLATASATASKPAGLSHTKTNAGTAKRYVRITRAAGAANRYTIELNWSSGVNSL